MLKKGKSNFAIRVPTIMVPPDDRNNIFKRKRGANSASVFLKPETKTTHYDTRPEHERQIMNPNHNFPESKRNRNTGQKRGLPSTISSGVPRK